MFLSVETLLSLQSLFCVIVGMLCSLFSLTQAQKTLGYS